MPKQPPRLPPAEKPPQTPAQPLTQRELSDAFRRLEIDRARPVIVHASLRAFGPVQGGAESVIGSLLSVFESVMMPVFTYKTMITPESGPRGNGITYGSGRDVNRMAVFFQPSLPADRLMGLIPETLRRHPLARRSAHPILSFTGVHVDDALESQSLDEPLAPIRTLTEANGWVLLLGVDHTVNTSIHYGERLGGRKQFVRWALTPQGTVECPGFPGCSNGFDTINPRLSPVTRRVQVGKTVVQAVPLADVVEAACSLVHASRFALLCPSPSCERCAASRFTRD